MKNKKFKARINSKYSDSDAEIIGSFIEENSKDLSITAEELVLLSKSERAPTHKYFDWNDKSAAEKYRIDQARDIISSLTVVIEGEDTKAFHSVYVEELDERRYVFIDNARKEQNLWQQVIDQAMKEVVGWTSRYEKYQELALIVEAVKTVRRNYEKENGRRGSSNTKD